ncbi:AGE family epimerase/isomerase [uncultured Brevundimonas sp.]|uniref:AGE family epimerase/isomerase n=1 Tax=uncultured Brevundimonas sp. TaxID=213418 RepID=UPI0025DA1384|nr:AGE family epimerase/isomerase [uncultured Brevundimonas sp.]
MMKLFPVIMCGGSGTRLWPASRPSRPKQFIPLSGNRSPFQETAMRVAPLATNGGRLLVVGGVAHRDAILSQLDAVGIEAQVLLEPEPRDSAPAMAAAALWTARCDCSGVNVFVASDHHIPDEAAFRASAIAAAEAAFGQGRIVTLGVKPNAPSSAYGYIAPAGEGLSPVSAFVEKPDPATARQYIEAGYLWNSGNFITPAELLLEELRLSAAAVEAAASAALPSAEGPVVVLGPEFTDAPKISIDYAVMENTRRASVLPVDFEWSDLGSWDAIKQTGEGDLAAHLFEDAEGCLVRACDGVMVAAVGVRDLAIVVEPDAVLVADLGRSQDVKRVVERLRTASPRHLDFPLETPESLIDGARRLAEWMRLSALPTWSALGQGEDGGFREVLALDGRLVSSSRRARVQSRQVQVFAEAGRLGWRGPWRRAVGLGLERINAIYLRSDGLMRTRLNDDDTPLDETATVYDQAFLLLALAVACEEAEPCAAVAARTRDALLAAAPPSGGMIEAGAHPYQSNAHMHLLEASMAWEEAGGDGDWRCLSDRIAGLALTRFIDEDGGFLREFFDSDWTPASGEDGSLVEPGHQFEWAWVLTRYARLRADPGAIAAARRLYAFGLKGVEPQRRIVVDALNADGSFRSRRARLWPQTEWLKAALILAEESRGAERELFLQDAARAQRAVWRYLTPQGLWRDKCLANGDFIDEAAPASSFYHIMAAFAQVKQTLTTLYPAEADSLTLS